MAKMFSTFDTKSLRRAIVACMDFLRTFDKGDFTAMNKNVDINTWVDDIRAAMIDAMRQVNNPTSKMSNLPNEYRNEFQKVINEFASAIELLHTAWAHYRTSVTATTGTGHAVVPANERLDELTKEEVLGVDLCNQGVRWFKNRFDSWMMILGSPYEPLEVNCADLDEHIHLMRCHVGEITACAETARELVDMLCDLSENKDYNASDGVSDIMSLDVDDDHNADYDGKSEADGEFSDLVSYSSDFQELQMPVCPGPECKSQNGDIQGCDQRSVFDAQEHSGWTHYRGGFEIENHEESLGERMQATCVALLDYQARSPLQWTDEPIDKSVKIQRTVFEQVKQILATVSNENIEETADRMWQIAKKSEQEQNGQTLRLAASALLDQALNDTKRSSLYARLYRDLLTKISPDVRDITVPCARNGGELLRKYVLDSCQEMFEGLNFRPPASGNELGLIRFVGNLFNVDCLTERIIIESCLNKLLRHVAITALGAACLCQLLTTARSKLDKSEKGQDMLAQCYERITGWVWTVDEGSQEKRLLVLAERMSRECYEEDEMDRELRAYESQIEAEDSV